MNLNFKNDKQIQLLVEKVKIGESSKKDAPSFFRLLQEAVEEVLDEQNVKFRFEEDGFVPATESGYVNEVDKANSLNCDEWGSNDAKKFEWVVIAVAKKVASQEGFGEAVATAVAAQQKIDALKAKPSLSKVEERELKDLETGFATTNRRYLCAAGPWYKNPKTGALTKVGKQAEQAIATALSFDGSKSPITLDDLAGATMDAVAKTAPAAGGSAIEAKTDVMFGNKRISLKMSGKVQAASAQGPNTAKALGAVLENWLVEHADDHIMIGSRKAAAKEVQKVFDEIRQVMMKGDLQSLLASTRATDIMKAIAGLKAKQEAGETLSSRDAKKLLKYENYLKVLGEHSVIDEAGKVVKKVDYDEWQNKIGDTIKEVLQELFTKFAAYDPKTGGQKGLSLQSALVDEMLTGRHLFGADSPATAQYILSPTHCFTLQPGDDGYEETIKVFSKAVTLDVRAKGGRSLKLEGGKTLAEVGVKPSYRFDIDDKLIDQVLAQTKKEIEQVALDSPAAEKQVEEVVEDALQVLQAKVTKLLESSLDKEAMAGSLKSDSEG